MALRVEAGVLVALAVAFAGPVPVVLARARWAPRAPRAALVLWQAVGLAGGLSLLGAGVTLAASSLSGSWLGGVGSLPAHWSRLGPIGWAGAALTLAAGLWLVTVAAASTTRVVLSRRAHRRRLDAVAECLDRPLAVCPADPAGPSRSVPMPALDDRRPSGGTAVMTGTRTATRCRETTPCSPCLLAGVHLLDHPAAVAYCLPGLRPRIVVSRGVLQTLDTDELAAVIAHERAHARGHHDLVVQPFVAWRQTFPFLRAADTALAAVDLLVE